MKFIKKQLSYKSAIIINIKKSIFYKTSYILILEKWD
jgi:hypothetical protein